MLRKKILLILGMTIISVLSVSAYDFAVKNSDGKVIYYNLISMNDKSVEVTFKDKNYNHYSGDLSIPAFVEYDDIVYSVVGVGRKAMRNCPELKILTLPESIKYIEYKALSGNDGLCELILPSSLQLIGYNGINYLENLISLYIYNLDPTTIDLTDTKLTINPSCTIHVPKGSSAKYKSHPIWSKFTIKEDLLR